MIKFNTSEDNKQFISIGIESGTNTEKVFNYISGIYPVICDYLYKMDNDEIIVRLENGAGYGFSLNALRSTVAEVEKANIYTFCVDMDEPTQRYRG